MTARLVAPLLTIAMLTLTAAVSAAAPVPFEDIDQDGIYTPGVDVDLKPQILQALADGDCSLSIFSEHNLVFPFGSIPVKPWCFVFVGTLGRMTWNANIESGPMDPDAGLGIKGEVGTTFGPGVRITSGGFMYLGNNGGRITVGDGGVYKSVFSTVEFAAYDNGADPTELVVGRNVSAYGGAVQLFSFGSIRVGTSFNGVVTADFGEIRAQADGPITLDQARRLEATFLVVQSGESISFQRNRPFITNLEGSVSIAAPGLVNITGTRLPANVFVDIFGDPIVGP